METSMSYTLTPTDNGCWLVSVENRHLSPYEAMRFQEQVAQQYVGGVTPALTNAPRKTGIMSFPNITEAAAYIERDHTGGQANVTVVKPFAPQAHPGNPNAA
jgi:hypothetical protein